ncbi:hypothetical protein EJ06DRAFT_225979 [Trichodelitschia bisporula]|uniref:Uncharacterized protein n=1 Tax=Trichodelitschia bisporula TaxID=703511 RepID=A0A6G1HKQ9_9PEZI|nr:hypothetical protein EJ06DRAFT_225979 [Trichodelitschia bisporula]
MADVPIALAVMKAFEDSRFGWGGYLVNLAARGTRNTARDQSKRVSPNPAWISSPRQRLAHSHPPSHPVDKLRSKAKTLNINAPVDQIMLQANPVLRDETVRDEKELRHDERVGKRWLCSALPSFSHRARVQVDLGSPPL